MMLFIRRNTDNYWYAGVTLLPEERPEALAAIKKTREIIHTDVGNSLVAEINEKLTIIAGVVVFSLAALNLGIYFAKDASWLITSIAFLTGTIFTALIRIWALNFVRKNNKEIDQARITEDMDNITAGDITVGTDKNRPRDIYYSSAEASECTIYVGDMHTRPAGLTVSYDILRCCPEVLTLNPQSLLDFMERLDYLPRQISESVKFRQKLYPKIACLVDALAVKARWSKRHSPHEIEQALNDAYAGLEEPNENVVAAQQAISVISREIDQLIAEEMEKIGQSPTPTLKNIEPVPIAKIQPTPSKRKIIL